jgi:aminopeptidase N
MRTPLWLSLAAAAAGPPGDEAVDVRRYDLEVVVLPETLRERIRIEAVAREALATWALDLVRPMEVRSASVNGKPAGLERKGDTVVLDMAGAGVGELSVELSVEGRPQERFSEDRGGFVRSDVTPDLAYVRSQVPWYPRAPDDAAAWRAVVETPIGWIARTAGREAGREEAADRVRWTFEEPRPFESAGLVAGPYRRVEGKAAGGAALDALVFPEDEKGAGPLLETARRALDHYGARFGSVEARRFTLVEMPATFGKGSGYGEAGYVLLGKGAFEEGGAAAWADALVAHEVAHTWWGREVGFTTFASESLASYSTLGFLEAERGAGAARAERQRAVTAIAKAASEGKTAALAEIRPWGRGMDPETYRVHAYEKAMMLLVMAEDALGRPAMDRSLAGFFARNRGSRVDWPELREALGAAGPAARVVLEQGEGPGVPILTVSHEARKSGGAGRSRGR